MHFNKSSTSYYDSILMYEVVTGTRAYKDILIAKNFAEYIFKQKVINGLRAEIKPNSTKKDIQTIIEKC